MRTRRISLMTRNARTVRSMRKPSTSVPELSCAAMTTSKPKDRMVREGGRRSWKEGGLWERSHLRDNDEIETRGEDGAYVDDEPRAQIVAGNLTERLFVQVGMRVARAVVAVAAVHEEELEDEV